MSSKEKQTFLKDVAFGLDASPKFLHSKYFYDTIGSEVFYQICQLPEYYLPACETEILLKYRGDIIETFAGREINVVEFGGGKSQKVEIIIETFIKAGFRTSLTAVDISDMALKQMGESVAKRFPTVEFRSTVLDYNSYVLPVPNERIPNFILYLGSNVGNLSWGQSTGFFSRLRKSLSAYDRLLIGFDVVKSPEILHLAYNDRSGLTSKFNLNLLERMNRDLGANFDISKFRHYSYYDPKIESVESYIFSLQSQEIFIAGLDKRIVFQPLESIHTEHSYKFTSEKIRKMADESGFTIVRNFFDEKNYFCNSLWKSNSQ